MSRLAGFSPAGCLALGFTVACWAASTAPPIVEAARNDDASTITALIARHSDVNAKSDDGTTALAWAAMRSDLPIAQALLKAGAKPDLGSVTGVTPLALAILNGSDPLVRLLLEHGANPNLSRDSGETPLMTACRLDRIDAMPRLIAHGADVNAKENQFQQTALMWAAAGHSDAVRLLLDHKADIAATTKSWDVKARKYGNGFTTLGKTGIPWVSQGEFDTKVGGYNALLFAVEKRDLASARMLLDAGADVNKPAADGATALLLALYKFEPSSGGLDTDLPMAAFLLDRGAKANVADLSGYTPLHGVVLAIAAASKPMPGGRRGGGARPAGERSRENQRQPRCGAHRGCGGSRRGGLAPSAAAEGVTDLLAMAMRLLDAGADPNRQTLHPTPGPIGDTRVNPAPPGSSPFHIAASVNNLDLIRLLYAHGANPNAISQEGHSPFTVAVKSGNLAVVKEMVAHGADLSARYNPDDMVSDPVESIARPRKGETVMHVAVVAGQAPVIQYLYSVGVPLDLKNEANETPLMLADSQERYQFALAMQNGRGATRSTALSDTIKKLLADGPPKAAVRGIN